MHNLTNILGLKKVFSLVCLVFIILSQFQILQVYAQSEAELASEKQKGEQTLEAVEQVIDSAVEKIDDKLGNNTQKKEKLEEKQTEIHEYLEVVAEEISEENSSENIKEKVEEAKKVVVLKVVSGVTEYEDVEDSIDSEVADTPVEIEEALETIQESMETESGDYSIIVRSNKSEGEVSKLFQTFDTETRIEFMYDADGENYFEVFLDEDSIFREEMLEDIESGILPEGFFGVEIVLPEVFGINELTLQGEDLSETWGIEQYNSHEYAYNKRDISKKITVGVVDTGIDYKHPDLKDNVNQNLGKDFVNDDDDAWDDQGHGTHVAGTIAANINGSGIIGVNPYVELIPLKICTERGFCPSYAVLRALEYAKSEKIDILNMSLGGRGTPDGHAICDGIASVVDAGGIVVAASGNSNIDTNRFVPGGCTKAITVAAVDKSGLRAPFSNYGSKVDVAAPGVQIYSTYPVNKGSYRKLSGTSMAAPHVAGIVSLMQSHDSNITAGEVKTALKKYTSSVKTDSDYKTIAAGVDVAKLMESYTPTQTRLVDTKGIGKIRYIRDWANGSNKNKNSHWVEIQAFDDKGENLARGKVVTTKNTDYSHRPMSRITDGILTSGSYTEGGAGINYAQVDLGNMYDVKNVNIKHYYADGRIYNETKTEVSVDGTNWIPIFDSGKQGVYPEPKDGSGRTYEVKEIKEESSSIESIRYIRDWLNGSSANAGNYWVEIEALEKGSGKNIAAGKTVIGSVPEKTTHPYSRVTDEKLVYFAYPSPNGGVRNVVVDLEELYDIEDVNITHYFKDGRTFYNTKTEVSADGIIWTSIFDSKYQGVYSEPKDGSGKTHKVQALEIPKETYDDVGIRYIRDWVNGSNKNKAGHWVEVQALDGSGNNRALGKEVYSSGVKSVSKPIERIVDGNTSFRNYASAGSGLKYAQVDLGGIIDIKEVKIWHYHKDGRIYNDTKTEVSSDGVNWTTLYDSAVSGTYAEPKDGSGRIYTVPRVKEKNKAIAGNLVKNGTFEGSGKGLPGRGGWIAGEERGWTQWSKGKATAELKEGRLYIDNPGGGSYIEVRNTNRGYYGIADNSIDIKPNTTYRIEYDYETEYVSGKKEYGFKLAVLLSKPDGTKSESFETIPYVNTTKGRTHVKHEFTTTANSEYLNISPVIYGHWGDKNLNMKAWVDNISLVELTKKTPTEVEGGVRYIRDYINGANNTVSNVWNEIQVVEKETGINLAKGIIPSTNISNISGAISRLTDGNTGNNWTGRYGGSGMSYMQLDLGAIYDVEQVKVWHYNDGRIYTEAKTEVSTDGVNWTTLHDSSVDGTYNEPRDGSGRTYIVNTITNNRVVDEIPGNLVKNGTFEGTGLRNKKSIGWIGAKSNAWSANLSTNDARAEIKDGKLELEVKNKSYVQARSIVGGHYSVTDESIAVKPNTDYVIEYDYRTEHISGDTKHGFNLYVLFQGENGHNAGYTPQNFVGTTQDWTHEKRKFTTSSTTNYVNIAPIIYGHWGDGDMHLKAWVDNISLIEVPKRSLIEVPEGVRYIRDYLSGSNKNTGNHWVEIQALDQDGKNIAEGLEVSGSSNPSSKRPLSRITDGDTKSGSYTGLSGENQSVTIDLGSIYDIFEVKIWHYYNDNRVYNNTKTEVSADGITWTKLYDSDTDGTYVEPRDGRSHKIKTIKTPTTESPVVDKPIVKEKKTEQTVKEDEKSELDDRDDSILDPNLTWTSDADKEAAKKLAREEGTDPDPSKVKINSVQLDIGNKEEIQINSVGERKIEREDIELEIVDQKETLTSYKDKVIYDEYGKIIDDSKIEINSSSEEIQTLGFDVGEDFGFDNLPELNFPDESGIVINSDLEDEPKIQELIIDGAKKGIEISSSQDLGEELIFATGSIDTPGDDEDFDGELIEVLEEEMDALEHDEEIFLDGAVKGVEINSSSSDEDFKEVEMGEYNPDQAESITGEPITGYDAGVIEINSTEGVELENNDFIEIEQVVEQIEEIEYTDEDIFIDGAEEGGVEINSTDSPDAVDIIPEEYIESSEEVIEIESELTIEGPEDTEFPSEDEIKPYEGEIIVEEIEDVEYSDEVVYTHGVEINSFGEGEDTGVRELSEEEYLEIIKQTAIPAIGEEEYEEIVTPEGLREEEKKYIEDGKGSEDAIEGTEYEEIGEDEEILLPEGEGENLGIQNTYYCSVEVGGRCNYKIYNAYRHTFNISNPENTKYYYNWHSLSIHGTNPGKSRYYMYIPGVGYHMIYVTVKEKAPEDIYVNLEYGTGKPVGFDVKDIYYEYSTRPGSWLHSQWGLVQAMPQQGRDYTINVKQGSPLKRTTHKIHVKNIPDKYSLSLTEGETLHQNIKNVYWYKPSYSQGGIIDVSRIGSLASITGKKAGKTTLYFKRPDNGAQVYAIAIEVKPKPKPKEYTVFLREGESKKLILPRDDDFTLYAKNLDRGSASVGDARKYHGYLNIKGVNAGNIDYYLKNKNGFVKYIVHIKVTPKPPVNLNFELFQGQKLVSPMSGAKNHNFTFSKAGYVTLGANSGTLAITGTKAGTIKIYAKRDGIHRYTISVKIKEVPKMKEHSITLHEGKETQIHLGEKTAYRAYFTYKDKGRVSIYSYSSQVKGGAKLRGTYPGNLVIRLRDYDGFTRHILNIKVVPTPPTTLKLDSIYETKVLNLKHEGLSSSVSKSGYVSFSRSSTYLRVTGNKAGEVKIYMKDSNGIHRKTYSIKILPRPKVINYNLKFTGGRGFSEVQLPDFIYNYKIYHEGDWIYDKNRLYEKSILVDIDRVGTSQIIFKDKKQGFTKYVINIVSEPSYEDYQIYVGDRIPVWRHNSYNFKEQDNTIVYYRTGINNSYLDGKKVGTTEIHISKENKLRKIWRVKVIPQPKRITVRCTTEVRKDCELHVPNSGYYKSSNIIASNVDIESTTKKIEVSAETSGVVTVYVRAKNGSYITHVFEVTVKARKAKVEDCDIPLNRSCTTYPINKSSEYVIKASNDKVRAYWETQYDSKNEKTGKKKLKIEGVSKGYSEVYIYRLSDHIATVKVTLGNEADEIRVDDRSIDVGINGNSKEIKILAGGGGYKIQNYKQDELKVSVSNKDDNTGIVRVQGLKLGKHYAEVVDKWGEILQLRIMVEAPELVLDTDEIDLKVGQSRIITAVELNGKIEDVKKVNNHISVTKLSDTTFEITGVSEGISIGGAVDSEGKYDGVTVYVKGVLKGGENPIKETPVSGDGIRYIRDWANGSDKNGWSLWLEIQAFEKGTGINLARGKKTTGSAPQNSTAPYSRITDGNNGYSAYSRPNVYGRSYVQVDLGQLSDIDSVKILRYYKDGRTFKETKTEVSADGINWTVLHDSAVSGTYAEPKDGSGRVYTIKETPVSGDGIRYIRDYLNGSNRNAGNHWLEIEALDKNGTNIAKGKSVTGEYPQRYDTKPFTRITDGSTSYKYYAEGKAYTNTYVTVDLGAVHDIEKVKIHHYHYDGGSGRIYKETKTEVSADGVNWIILYDSAISGTYAEPKDGSGRTYEVKIKDESSTNLSESERFLQELFEGLGLNYDGVEVAQSSAGGGSPNDIYGPEFCKHENYFECQEKFRLQKATDRDERIITEERGEELNSLIDRIITKDGIDRLKYVEERLIDVRWEIRDDKVPLYNVVYSMVKIKIDEEAYLQGVLDTLTLNDLYDVAVGVGTGYGAGKILSAIVTKYPRKFAGQIGARVVPYAGWSLTAYSLTSAGVVNKEYAKHCLGTTDFEGKSPQYYCGKMTVNSILILGGMTAGSISGFHSPGVFKRRIDGAKRREMIVPCAISHGDNNLSVANNGCIKWSNQDKQLGSSQLEILAQENGYSKFHKLKDDFVPNSDWDAFRNIDGEVYFKAKTGKGNSFEPVFTGFIIK